MTTSSVFKSMGWTVVCSPITGELYISRADSPGELIVRKLDNGYEMEAHADSETFVTGTFAPFEGLTSEVAA